MNEDHSASLREPLISTTEGDDRETETTRRRIRWKPILATTSSTTIPTTDVGIGNGEDSPGDRDESATTNDFSDTNGDSNDTLYSNSESVSCHLLARAETNIARSLGAAFLSSADRTLWSQSLVPVFCGLVWKDHLEYVGFVSATLGIFQTVSSLVLARRQPPNEPTTNHLVMVARLLSFIGIAAIALSLWSMFRSVFGWFLLSNGILGMFWGGLDFVLPVVLVESEGVLASIREKQEHDSIERRWTQWATAGSIVGTLFAVGGFGIVGNEWTAQNCFRVLAAGIVINPIVVWLWCLRSMGEDDDTEGASVEDHQSSEPDAEIADSGDPPTGANGMGGNSNRTEEYTLRGEPLGEDGRGEDYDDDEDEDDDDESVSEPRSRCAILVLMVLAETLSSLAGGMSSWYLPVFLARSLGLAPLVVQCLYLVVILGQFWSPWFATGIAATIGVCWACILLEWAYVALLGSMVICQAQGIASVWILGSLYVLHGSLTNSTRHLSECLFVRYHHNNNSTTTTLETLQKLLWSGAGILGGLVVQRWGLLSNLGATAVLQFLASLPLVVLYCCCSEEDLGDEEPTLDDRGDEKPAEASPGPASSSTPATAECVSGPSGEAIEPTESDDDGNDGNDDNLDDESTVYYDALTFVV